jgi:hypothetical protein
MENSSSNKKKEHEKERSEERFSTKERQTGELETTKNIVGFQ